MRTTEQVFNQDLNFLESHRATDDTFLQTTKTLAISVQDANQNGTVTAYNQVMQSKSTGLCDAHFGGITNGDLVPPRNQGLDGYLSHLDPLVDFYLKSSPDSTEKHEYPLDDSKVDLCLAEHENELDRLFFGTYHGCPIPLSDQHQSTEFNSGHILPYDNSLDIITMLRNAPLEFLANLGIPFPQHHELNPQQAAASRAGASVKKDRAAETKRNICHLCRKTFARAGDLKRHSAVHSTGLMPFKCTFDGCEIGARGFYRKDKRRDHERRVHGIK